MYKELTFVQKMLLFGRFSKIGLHLLLIIHISHTFVLFTANMDDIKKLARNFVSDKLADKIAEFFKQASFSTQVSEKSKHSEESGASSRESSHQVKESSHRGDLSEENKMFNIERQAPEKETTEYFKEQTVEPPLSSENAEDSEVKEDSTTEPNLGLETLSSYELDKNSENKKAHNKEKLKNLEKIKKVKERHVGRLNGPSLYVADGLSAKIAMKPSTKPSRISIEDEKYEQDTPPSIKENKYLEGLETTTSDLHNYLISNPPKIIKGQPYKLLALSSVEDNIVSDDNITLEDRSEELEDFKGRKEFGQSLDIDNTKTTKKAAYEFDQFKPTISPSLSIPELIGTSGSVTLPKMDNSQWWEKAMPTDSKRKSWF